MCSDAEVQKSRMKAGGSKTRSHQPALKSNLIGAE